MLTLSHGRELELEAVEVYEGDQECTHHSLESWTMNWSRWRHIGWLRIWTCVASEGTACHCLKVPLTELWEVTGGQQPG